ncbi:methyltransferase domain-containing protein [Neoroseomonas oryzicola]|uniref:Methyltransferase domain-containing protein n=1 Tax=Neoroseomonas oryzicola TaxID=535904 RepID=A0A9X9WD75_9PROT|nr:methyltransferase domain-containing protein [Neoroseomonas oryzicola]NKE18450.1 methyltransferase domain-containing protein [Neoroseomonas oryzicola]
MSGTTDDLLLGGRVRLRQPAQGFRAGLDAVLLAAFVPARPGDRVLEAGCGSGAAFLCLAARVPGLEVTAVEREPAMAALARENAAANGVAATVEDGDVADVALARRLGPVEHAFANPPYWPGGTPPPGAIRRAATHEGASGLDAWARFLAAALKDGGTASLVLPAARFDAGVAALRDAGCGATTLLPLAPRAGQAAKRVLIRARRGGRGPATLLPPFVLHEADGRFTAAAESVLRDAAPI